MAHLYAWRALRCALALLLAAAWALPGHAADTYPDRPIRFVVGFPPGGGNDALARLVAARIGQLRGWQVVVENVAGSGGILGTSAIAKAAPDGYTVGMGSVGTLTINPSLYARLPFDVTRDLAPVSMLSETPAALVVPAGSPAHSVAELIALARSRPGGLNFGSAGSGTSHHLAAVLFQQMAGLDLVHVPYAGSAPAVTGLIRSDVQMMFADLPAVLPMIRAGKLRALAVTSPGRSPSLPEVPPLADTLPGYDVSVWYAVIAPARTPPAVIETLNRAIRDVAAQPDVRAQLEHEGVRIEASTPQQLADMMRAETARWAKVVKSAHVTVQ